MYQFVDRALASLAPDRLFLVRAMRVWVLAAHQGRCPCHTLAAWFADAEMAGAMPHFRIMMAALHRDGAAKLVFGMPDRATVTEDEAILLALTDAIVDPALRRGAAGTLVKPDVAELFAKALTGVADALAVSHRLHPDHFPRDTGDTL